MNEVIRTDDYHTGGEPFRIVVGGVPPLRGDTVLDRRSWATANLDHIRRLIVNEPRGHADMYGCFVTDGEAGADLGAVFFHKDGFSTACGHGTIALATWAIDEGRVAVSRPETEVIVDVPSGRLRARAFLDDHGVTSVRFENVPAYPTARATPVETTLGPLAVDIAYGGASYGSVALDGDLPPVRADGLPQLIGTARQIRARLRQHPAVVHRDDDRLSGLYGVVFHETVSDDPLHQRNVTVFADGEVDRSPCGSGTSARLALLHDDGIVAVGGELRHESIVGSVFVGRIVGTVAEPPGAVLTSIEGSAYRCGRSEFWLDPRDPLGLGFQLR